MSTDALIERLQDFWSEAWTLWRSGDWAMLAIAGLALVMFAMGMRVHLKLREKKYRSVPESTWRRWIDRPGERRGRLGQLLDFVTGTSSLEDTAVFFQQLRTTETVPFERDLKVMKTCVGAAPLVGLLGTVTGMLATFGALASGSGGDKTMALVAEGISEALITTETGLVIALPGLFLQYQLVRRHERYKQFLAHLETVCNQSLFRKLRHQELQVVRRAARAQVAGQLLVRLRQARPGTA